jgi:hypothetical protein
MVNPKEKNARQLKHLLEDKRSNNGYKKSAALKKIWVHSKKVLPWIIIAKHRWFY